MIVFDYVKKEKNRVLSAKGSDNPTIALYDRFEYFRPFVEPHLKKEHMVSVSNIFLQNKRVCFVGMVLSKKTTKNGHLLFDIEDPTGIVRVLINKDNKMFTEAKDVLLDSVVGIDGKIGKEIVFCDDIVFPNIFSPRKTQQDSGKYLLFISALDYKQGEIKNLAKEVKRGTIAVFFVGITGDVVSAQQESTTNLSCPVFFIPQQKSFATQEYPQMFLVENDFFLHNPSHIDFQNIRLSLFYSSKTSPSIKQVVKCGHFFPSYSKSKTRPQFDGELFLQQQTDIVFFIGQEDVSFLDQGVAIFSKKQGQQTYIDTGSLREVSE